MIDGQSVDRRQFVTVTVTCTATAASGTDGSVTGFWALHL